MPGDRQDMFQFCQLPVHIVQKRKGIARGHSIADVKPYASQKNMEGKKHLMHIAFQLVYQKFYREFMSVMTGQSF